MEQNQITHKKNRNGRWSRAETSLFQELLERYGKNWIKIHEHMRLRSLSQIRSHAQKYFDKISPKKAQQFERRAKVLEAYATLEKEKRLQKDKAKDQISSQRNKDQEIIKQEEQLSLEGPPAEEQSLTCLHSNIKEVQIQQSMKQEERNYDRETPNLTYGGFPYQVQPFANQGGFLISLINLHPHSFSQYGLDLKNLRSQPNSQQPIFFPGYQK